MNEQLFELNFSWVSIVTRYFRQMKDTNLNDNSVENKMYVRRQVGTCPGKDKRDLGSGTRDGIRFVAKRFI